jgi:hypothetical protein
MKIFSYNHILRMIAAIKSTIMVIFSIADIGQIYPVRNESQINPCPTTDRWATAIKISNGVYRRNQGSTLKWKKEFSS